MRLTTFLKTVKGFKFWNEAFIDHYFDIPTRYKDIFPCKGMTKADKKAKKDIEKIIKLFKKKRRDDERD